MRNRYESAEMLAALWKLGGDEMRMPTSHGILDRALHALREEMPAQLGSELHFSDTTVGLRCFELPGILVAAQEALLTSEPNPTYLSTDIMLDEDAARQIVVGAELSTSNARAMGRRLREEVGRISSEFKEEEPVAA